MKVIRKWYRKTSVSRREQERKVRTAEGAQGKCD